MCFGDSSLLCKIVYILLILCFIIDLTGFALPFWYSKEYTILEANFKIYGGLWDLCAESGVAKECGSIIDNDLAVWFRAVRAFSIMSWLFFFAALVAVNAFMKYDKKAIYLVAICLNFAGAFCALIAFAVYAGESSGVFKEYSASFALTITSFILGLIIGVLGILDYLEVVGGQ